MSFTAEVGSGQVPVFPTFKGFRQATDKEVTGATTSASNIFKSGFTKAGNDSGVGFAKAFGAQSNGALNRSLTEAVAKASRDLSTVRLREQDATGKLRVAEAQLSEARGKYASDSSQVIRAEERLATAQRSVDAVQDNLRSSTNRLAAAKRDLTDAANTASSSGGGLRRTMDGLVGMFRSGPSAVRNYATEVRSGLGTIFAGNFLADAAGSAFRIAGRVAAVSFAVGLGSIQLAADLGETRSAVEQVFGPTAAAELNTYASTANTALGQTRTSVLRASQNFGVFGRAAGLTDTKLSSFSTRLVALSTDLASFYNEDPAAVIEALGAGLRGEAEPLRRFGVLMDDATLRQKALELGIYDGNGSLTAQQKILAANELIFASTGFAQGDFARTSEGLANQQRILAASLEDTQVKLGEYLLPGFTSIVTYANGELLPRLGEIADRVGPKLAAALDTSAPKFEQTLDRLTPFVDKLTDAGINAIPGFIESMNDIVTNGPEFLQFLEDADTKVTELTDQFYGAQDGVFDFFKPIREFFTDRLESGTDSPMVRNIKGSMIELQDEATATRESVSVDFSQMNDNVFTNSSSMVQNIKNEYGKIPTEVPPLLRRVIPEFLRAGEDATVGFASGILAKKDQSDKAAQRIADSSSAALRRALQIQSPSKVWGQAGDNSAEGYIGGVRRRIGDASRVSGEFARATSRGLSLTSMLAPDLPASGRSGSGADGRGSGVYAPITIYAGEEDGRVLGRKFGREFSNQWG